LCCCYRYIWFCKYQPSNWSGRSLPAPISWEDRLQCDLWCVEWDLKSYCTISICHAMLISLFQTFCCHLKCWWCYCNDVARVQLCCLCVFGHREWQAVLCFVEIVWLMLIDVLWSTTTMMSRVYHGLERLWYNLLISWPSCCGQHGPTNSAINWSCLVTLQWSGLWDVISLQALRWEIGDKSRSWNKMMMMMSMMYSW